ncbi:uncharacterized protein LOC118439024 isoform X1 [Folsomia candida]|uniref:uncharacterized protein LOC118439024 isoform X1 n=1 Tax=Folsomia candida TaxID=158441 RepID=UPI0016051B05|nr:uncharacterized protein LOC118439024 isoform X1 [Folsomia candida]XP_035715927.1 uncharacterized protein LOC118439024 isoform X1 [Folsomia candida]XP_035715928.1 uncharacterized protein LOC118439024 isoform X1 [Folsomia candida]XP_035715929.1 uncharacterized protein LOC118439024 isoform X1 [Folsomia candida]
MDCFLLCSLNYASASRVSQHTTSQPFVFIVTSEGEGIRNHLFNRVFHLLDTYSLEIKRIRDRKLLDVNCLSDKLHCCYCGVHRYSNTSHKRISRPLASIVWGALESYKDTGGCWGHRNYHCRKTAPEIPTQFGVYISSVCGNHGNATGSRLQISEKCRAARRLQTGIYLMYIWAMELFAALSVEFVYGLGNRNNKNEPEYSYTE